MTAVGEHVGELAAENIRIGAAYHDSAWWVAYLLAFARAVPAVGAIGLTTVATGYGYSRSALLTDDEGTYVAQAWAITHLGSLTPYTYWYDHPPVGWMTLALLQSIIAPFTAFGTTIDGGRAAMLPVTLASATLLYTVARRSGMARAFATLSVCLFGLSPLAIQYHRMVLLDNFAVVWTLAAMALALTPQRRLWATAASGACFAFAVLSKETAILLLPVLMLLIWQHCDARTRRFACTLAATLFAFIVLSFPLVAALKSELVAGQGHVSMESAIRWQFFERPSSGTILDNRSGASGVVRQWLTQDRWLLLAAFAMLPIAALVRNLRPFALGFGTLVLIPAKPGYLPMMFVISILPLAALVVGGSLDTIWHLGARRLRDRRKRMLPLRLASPLAAIGLLAAATIVAGPAWSRSLDFTPQADHNRGYREVIRYVTRSIPHQSTLVVDDNMWLDLVEGGFQRDRVVWMYKLGRDPAVDCRYPGGSRDFDYIVVSPTMRALKFDLPATFSGLHAMVVATFGSGADRYTVLRIEHGYAARRHVPLTGCPAIP